jgi:dTDP-4-dehydrorhamnose reductase
MKILVIGGNGMAGHMIVNYLKKRSQYQLYYTSRKQTDQNGIKLDVKNHARLQAIIDVLSPHIVINCAGILNDEATRSPLNAIHVNSLLPHFLAKTIEKKGGKLVHISTDCVFSGKKGDYTEHDFTDGTTMYARTKALGEINDSKHVTVRTSIIGPEIRANGIGLFKWFLQQEGMIKGYEKVVWNGVTTLELAKAIEKMIEHGITGLYHLTAPDKVSKCKLLELMKNVFLKEDVTIVPDSAIVLDRTLKNTRTDFHYSCPDYLSMLIDLKAWMRTNE